MLNTLSTKLVQ